MEKKRNPLLSHFTHITYLFCMIFHKQQQQQQCSTYSLLPSSVFLLAFRRHHSLTWSLHRCDSNQQISQPLVNKGWEPYEILKAVFDMTKEIVWLREGSLSTWFTQDSTLVFFFSEVVHHWDLSYFCICPCYIFCTSFCILDFYSQIPINLSNFLFIF